MTEINYLGRLKRIKSIFSVVLMAFILFFSTACSELQQKIEEVKQKRTDTAARTEITLPRTENGSEVSTIEQPLETELGSELEKTPKEANPIQKAIEEVKEKITDSSPKSEPDEELSPVREAIEEVKSKAREAREEADSSVNPELNKPNPLKEAIEDFKSNIEEARQPIDETDEGSNPVSETLKDIETTAKKIKESSPTKTEEESNPISETLKDIQTSTEAADRESNPVTETIENIQAGVEEAVENLKQLPEKVESAIEESIPSNDGTEIEVPEKIETESDIPPHENQPIDMQLRNISADEVRENSLEDKTPSSEDETRLEPVNPAESIS